jgi:serine/threonine protein phosphatase PrpC
MAVENIGSFEPTTCEPPSLQIEVAALSDVGCKRSNNQDSFGYDLKTNIFVVCDGMGGMAAGEVASSVAVNRMLQSYKERFSHGLSPEVSLQSAIASANQAVWRLGKTNKTFHGMGTTLVAACIHNNHIVIGNVGDSRAYFLRDGGCMQITEDHSYLAERTLRADKGEDSATCSLLQCFITRAVGVESDVKPDLFVAELQAGDMILLATDGLTRYVDAGDISKQVQSGQDLMTICRCFVGFAHERGAADNVTCLLIRAFPAGG